MRRISAWLCGVPNWATCASRLPICSMSALPNGVNALRTLFDENVDVDARVAQQVRTGVTPRRWLRSSPRPPR